MKAIVQYSEIEKIIAEKINKPILLKYVADETVNIAYGKKILFQSISVDLTIVDIMGTNVKIKYGSNAMIDSIVAGALKFIENSPYGELFDILEDKTVLLRLDRVPQLTKVLEICLPESLVFSEKDVELSLKLK